MVKIYNEDCFETMKRLGPSSIDLILTSPPYNTGRPQTSERSRDNYESRYDVHLDAMSQSEYIDWSVRLFNGFDSVLKKNGVVLYNISYGSDSTVNTESIGLMWLVVAEIIKQTKFTVADRIIWKKASALPNNTSPNRLTRIVEDVFVFARKDEILTFNANKVALSIGSNGQTFYANVFNYVGAKNNDGPCALNKATYSSELCEKLLNIYLAESQDVTVYDPFMGSGTTAVACQRMGFNCVGSEISENQVKWAYDRLSGDSAPKDGDTGSFFEKLF